MIDFPNSPTVGQVFMVDAYLGKAAYQWDGTTWNRAPTPATLVDLSGVNSKDVDVPPYTNMARISAIYNYTNCPAGSYFDIAISQDGTTFDRTANYDISGWNHFTGGTPPNDFNDQGTSGLIQPSLVLGHIADSAHWCLLRAEIKLKAWGGTRIEAMSHGISYFSSAGYGFINNYWRNAYGPTGGVAAQKLRFLIHDGTTIFSTPSRVRVEWF